MRRLSDATCATVACSVNPEERLEETWQRVGRQTRSPVGHLDRDGADGADRGDLIGWLHGWGGSVVQHPWTPLTHHPP